RREIVPDAGQIDAAMELDRFPRSALVLDGSLEGRLVDVHQVDFPERSSEGREIEIVAIAGADDAQAVGGAMRQNQVHQSGSMARVEIPAPGRGPVETDLFVQGRGTGMSRSGHRFALVGLDPARLARFRVGRMHHQLRDDPDPGSRTACPIAPDLVLAWRKSLWYDRHHGRSAGVMMAQTSVNGLASGLR
ncbi:MAG: hypothetical protein L0271_17125, partial [Gemmatimonadetes bacterium]|nr:hypothetical protein [Gemmatimonadota bacterium]